VDKCSIGPVLSDFSSFLYPSQSKYSSSWSADAYLECQHPPSILADLAAMLLSNLSAQQSVCTQLISLKVPVVLSASLTYHYYPTQSRSATSTPPTLNSESMQKDLDALPLLVDAFASSAKVTVGDTATPSTRKGELHFLSSVFANLSVVCLFRGQSR